MFCYQCEETLKNVACTKVGVCGKTDDVAELQDLLIYNLKGIAFWIEQNKKAGLYLNHPDEADNFTVEALFSTVTNVNFDKEDMMKYITQSFQIRNRYKELYLEKNGKNETETTTIPDSALYELNTINIDQCLKKAKTVSIEEDKKNMGEDAVSLRELLMYGLKGAAAYAHHASILGYFDSKIFDFFYKALNAFNNETNSIENIFSLVVECGEIGVQVMALLDKANTEHYGNPEPTSVNVGYKKGKSIMISGHDLFYLEELLKQTDGLDINIYTHGEMLPALAYPGFKKYKHFIGHYGTAWHNQRTEFEDFAGPIVMTTNCIQKPKESYEDRIFTMGPTGYPGVKHIGGVDFSEVIAKALSMNGFENDSLYSSAQAKQLTIGFAHDTLLKNAGKILELVGNGKIKQFLVMAGCDGREKEREYYTDTAKNMPADSVILTAGCAKFRYNSLELGDIDGIPRVLDAGQCNDSYSFAVTALKLKEVLNLSDINDLPIYYDIAWYEQKAVLVLLALLYLGVKNIKLGPNLPAFLSENVKNILIEKFNISQPRLQKQEAA